MTYGHRFYVLFFVRVASAFLPHGCQQASVELDLFPFMFHLGFLPHLTKVWEAETSNKQYSGLRLSFMGHLQVLQDFSDVCLGTQRPLTPHVLLAVCVHADGAFSLPSPPDPAELHEHPLAGAGNE